jgi:DNA-binding NtrC family response regulator
MLVSGMLPGGAMSQKILIVDDEYATSRLYSVILTESGYPDVVTCEDSRDAMDIIAEQEVDLVLTDLIMPHLDGRDLLMKISERYPDIPVIILTAQDRVETAVECMKFGAFDFMTKPVDANRLISAVQHAITIRELKEEVNILASERTQWELQQPKAFEGIITCSAKMHKIFAYMEAIVQSPKAVLITGESGTGKELVARALHELRGDRGNFVAVNVSGLDDTVFSDSLFGHRRGSFTGADESRKGLIEQANGGTLFLDEIGDLQPQSQVKLLRLLQEGEYYPLGSDEPETCDARIIAATNADLHIKQEEGRFRRDLYYRLIAHHIELPPLRERPEDIPLLIGHFLEEAQVSLDRLRTEVPSELSELLKAYQFPGNIRELQGLMYDLVTSSPLGSLDPGVIREYLSLHREESAAEDFSESLEEFKRHYREGPGGILVPVDRMPAMRALEHFLYQEALDRMNGNQSRAARMLDISQSTLSRWKQQLDGKKA